MVDEESVGARLRAARTSLGLSQEDLAVRAGSTKQAISCIERGVVRMPSADGAHAMCEALNISFRWLITGQGHKSSDNYQYVNYSLDNAGEEGVIAISTLDEPTGSGVDPGEMRPKLLMDRAWFERYDIARPEDAIAVVVGDNSMADFIRCGDYAVFNVSKRTPKHGEIYLIEHPIGKQIRKFHMNFDGSWILKCLNQNNQEFPDERVAADQLKHLIVIGEFAFRHGG